MANTRRKLFAAAQWILAAAIVWYAASALHGQWSEAAERLQTLHPDWRWIGAATGIVLVTYLLLIETWRHVIIAAGEKLPRADAARIWFVSNLGKYVPGKVWSIAAMTMMARESRVSPLTAAGSSILMQLVTVAAGIGVVLVTGASAVDHPQLAIAAAVAIVALLAATPSLMPMAGRTVSSLTGKRFDLPAIPARVVWLAILSSIISWITYGIAFQFFVKW